MFLISFFKFAMSHHGPVAKIRNDLGLIRDAYKYKIIRKHV